MNESKKANKLILAKYAGFCFGVKRGVSLAQKAAKQHGRVYSLGPLIHNKDAVSDLEKRGVYVVSDVSECKKGDVLIFRCHGATLEEIEKARSVGACIIDATCPYVSKIQNICEKYAQTHYVILAGDPEHPEVKGILSRCKGKGFAVNSIEALESVCEDLKNNSENALILVAQTTFDIAKWQEYKKTVQKHCTNVQIFDTICSATMFRQTEAENLASESDVMVVVGGHNSSNSKKLADVCRRCCDTTLFVENAAQCTDEVLLPLKRKMEKGSIQVAITAGASTPADIIKEVHILMSETLRNDDDIDFLAEVDKTFKKIYVGNRVRAYVVAVHNTELVVDIGTKHSGYIPVDELSPTDVVKPGDEIECVVTSINDSEGIIYLSKKKVDAALGVEKLAAAKENNDTLEGVVNAVVKGGLIVIYHGARVFIPASQSGVPRTGKLEDLLKKKVEFKVIEVNETRGRVVGSIKLAQKEKSDAVREKFWSEIEIGKKYIGEVKSMESYGVFVDLGGVDGMVHSTELTWNRIKHPKEIVNIGDKLEVYVKAFDPEKKRVSLGAKDPNDDPWAKFLAEFAVGDTVKAQVVSLTPFGAFAQIIPGVDGLIHISQISKDRVTNVAQFINPGDVVEVKITEIDTEKSRVSLSMKALNEEEEEVASEAAVEEATEETKE
jgi:4-hydroxy-3-methylbut-2-enyl diphosphate reductase